MNRRLDRQAAVWAAALLVGASLAVPVRADPQATYQGKPLSAWLDAMRNDLDPEYRRAAMQAVVQFGDLAIPRLSEMLNQDQDSDGLRSATIALIRIGPAGRAVVGERLTKDPKLPLLHVIDGISQSGVWARAFVSYLRTLANAPEVSLIALRTLAQAEGLPDLDTPDPLVERRSDGRGGSVFLTPLDCFVKDRFSSIRVGVSPADGATVRQVGLTFKGGRHDAVYWTPARPVSGADPGRLQYEAMLPKINSLGLTMVSYAILVETSVGDINSEDVLAAISPTEEGCVMVGARPVPQGFPSGTVSVLALKDRPKVTR